MEEAVILIDHINPQIDHILPMIISEEKVEEDIKKTDREDMMTIETIMIVKMTIDIIQNLMKDQKDLTINTNHRIL